MRKYLLIQIIITAFMFAQTDGEVVKNVSASQRTDGSKILDIYYDLEESELYTSYDIHVDIEWSDGPPQSDYPTNLSLNYCGGDVWFDVLPGDNKHITCQLPEEEWIQLSGQFYVNVRASASASSENPFEMVSFYPTDNDPGSFNYNFELMKKEVTAAQYVQFLIDKLSSAESVDYYDIEEEEGIFFNRFYHFGDCDAIIGEQCFNTATIVVSSNIDGHGGIILMQWDGNDWDDAFKGSSIPSYEGLFSDWGMGADHIEQYPLIGLQSINNEDIEQDLHNGPNIQFSSSGAGADDFSFFITPGAGNHPVTGISYLGAKLFAEHYGLRMPYYKEYLYSMTEVFDLFNAMSSYDNVNNINDLMLLHLEDISNDLWTYVEDAGLVSNELPYTTYPVDDSYILPNGISGMFDNAPDMMLQKYPNEFLETEFFGNHVQIYDIYYTFGINSDTGNIFDHYVNDNWTFRCANTIRGSYTGNND